MLCYRKTRKIVSNRANVFFLSFRLIPKKLMSSYTGIFSDSVS